MGEEKIGKGTGPETGSKPTLVEKSAPMVQCGAAVSSDTMESFLVSFEKSTKRWEKMVYPAMFAFMLLAAYGFFLIYSLTSDMRTIATNLDPNMSTHMERMSENMVALSGDIRAMTDHVSRMTETIHEISAKMDPLAKMPAMLEAMERLDETVAGMDHSVAGMSTTMGEMDASIARMSQDFYFMRRDMGIMSRNVSRPLSMMNSFLP